MIRPRRVYWDACAWISYIAQEKEVPLKGGGIENRFEKCRRVLNLARDGKLEVVTSAFTLAEVCKDPDIKNSPLDNLASYFQKSYVLVIPVDLSIGRAAQELQTAGVIGIKPPDAIHVASARRAQVSEFHTYDRKLFGLDGTFIGAGGMPMKFCKPSEGSGAGPLFD